MSWKRFFGDFISGSGGSGVDATARANAVANTADIAAINLTQATQDALIAATPTNAQITALQAQITANVDDSPTSFTPQGDGSVVVSWEIQADTVLPAPPAIIVDSAVSSTSTRPLENQAIKSELDARDTAIALKADKTELPTPETKDTTPTAGSVKAVESRGVKAGLDLKIDNSAIASASEVDAATDAAKVINTIQLKRKFAEMSITGDFIGSSVITSNLPTTSSAGKVATNGDWAVSTGSTKGVWIYDGLNYSFAFELGSSILELLTAWLDSGDANYTTKGLISFDQLDLWLASKKYIYHQHIDSTFDYKRYVIDNKIPAGQAITRVNKSKTTSISILTESSKFISMLGIGQEYKLLTTGTDSFALKPLQVAVISYDATITHVTLSDARDKGGYLTTAELSAIASNSLKDHDFASIKEVSWVFDENSLAVSSAFVITPDDLVATPTVAGRWLTPVAVTTDLLITNPPGTAGYKLESNGDGTATWVAGMVLPPPSLRVLATGLPQQTEEQLQDYYDSVLGHDAPDTVPQEVVDAANLLNNTGYKLYLGETTWWYTNLTISTAEIWTSFAKSAFSQPIQALYTFR